MSEPNETVAQKLRASIKAATTVAYGASSVKVKEWADRLTAIIERGAR